ncbi:hypothetical protein HID58_029195 [Brassica napus]|uniref:Nucleotide-diphospho-sugar transferase domain-containing protein n=2 Tax=Brassica napus TaxID=3708 RepID=A0ABQ8CCE4_BRANA|nr:hypothetical protein HID58_029195 [Brassica napus]
MMASFRATINSLNLQQVKQMMWQLQAKWREFKWAVSLLLLTVLLYVVVYHSASLVPNFPASVAPVVAEKQEINNIDSIEAEDMINLEGILKEASMKDKKTLIITLMNQAWAEPNSTFDVFLESFRIGNGTSKLLPHIVVMCLDDKAYSRCLDVLPRRCILLRTAGVDFSVENRYMVGDYVKMMWRRIKFLGSLLKLGYNFLFTDMDTIWLRDPFPRLVADVDFQAACNLFFNGNFSDRQHNEVNGGFKFVTANHRTIKLYKYWYKSRLRFPGKHDQDVLNYIRSDQYINKIGLDMRFIDTVDVGSFCQPNWDITKVSVLHGNCCIGQSNKVKDLRQFLEDWTIFFGNGNKKRSFRQPMNCRRSVGWRPPRKHKRRG